MAVDLGKVPEASGDQLEAEVSESVSLGKAARRLNWKEVANPYPEGSADFHMWRFGYISEGVILDLRKAEVVMNDAAKLCERMAEEIEAKRREG